MVLFVCRVGIGPGKHSLITQMLKLGTELYAPVQFLPLGAIEEHPGSNRAQIGPKNAEKWSFMAKMCL